jgi:type I restriction enzyme S subunit
VKVQTQLVSYCSIAQEPRWDFRYFDPKYLEIQKLLDTGNYPAEPLANHVKQIANFGAYSLCNLLVWVDDGIPYLRVSDLKEDGIVWSGVPRIPSEVHAQLPKSKVFPHDVLYSMAGTIGLAVVAPEDSGECNSNQAVAQIRLKDSLDPYYLATFLNSRLGRYQSERIANGQTVLNINMGEIGRLRIPIPPRPIQDRIAQVMQDAYTTRREKLAQVVELLNGIDRYVFETLGLAPEGIKESKRFLKRASEIRGSRLDVGFNMGFHKLDAAAERILPVEAVAGVRKETRDPSSEPSLPFQYVDISSIDVETGEIEAAREIIGVDAPSRARQVVHTGDIIVSTVRPTRGAIALISEAMDEFICSTGFTVLHPNNEVISKYLHTALRLSTTLEQFGRRSAGSSYPAILDDDVMETLIPVPKKETQEQIASEVVRRHTEAKHLRAEAQAVVAEAKARVERMILGQEAVQ